MNQTTPTVYANEKMGLLSGGAAFIIWGLLVLYWKELHAIPALDTVAYRVFWAILTFVPVVSFFGCWKEIQKALSCPTILRRLGCAACLLTCNWLLYIWAITNGRVIEASLGYFITPLMVIAIGRVILKESLTFLQGLAIAITCVGVLISVIAYGQVPWVALMLAVSFASYSFFRKTVPMSSIGGLFLESLMLLPLALIWLGVQWATQEMFFFDYSGKEQLLLMGLGAITIIPISLFTYASHNIPLTHLGLLQYLAPTLKLLLGIYVFQEALTPSMRITLVCIWVSLALYTWCTIRHMRMHSLQR